MEQLNKSMPITAKSLVNKTSQLYSLPTIYTQLDEAIKDPFSELQDLAKILLDDAGISARVLKLANSAFYSFPSKIETITRAITIIGTKQLGDIVLATCVINLFKNIPEEVIDMDSFWRHSIATGICARVISTYQREPNVERFYLMGLLHDIGRLIMFIHIPDRVSKQIQYCKTNNMLLHLYEQHDLGFDHAEVGQYLLESWNLPKSIQKAVGNHHKPMYSIGLPKEAAIIHFSDIVANALQLGNSGESFVPPLNEQAWKSLELKPSQIPTMIEHIEKQYEDVVDIFLS